MRGLPGWRRGSAGDEAENRAAIRTAAARPGVAGAPQPSLKLWNITCSVWVSLASWVSVRLV